MNGYPIVDVAFLGWMGAQADVSVSAIGLRFRQISAGQKPLPQKTE